MSEATPTKRDVAVRVNLEPPLAKSLKSAAARDGRSASNYVRRVLSAHFEAEPGRRPEADQ